MRFDYFYNEQSESYSFYRTPKVFFTDDRFRCLSSDAKILYGILLDRVSLSARNKWIDEQGRIYVYMTISSIEKSIGRCHQKSCKLLDELERIGLIERVKQGQGKPTRIYVKNFIVVCGSYSKKYEKHTQGSMSDISLEVCKSSSNNTEINNTDNSNNNPILSGNTVDNDKDMDERNAYREYLIEQLSMEILFERYPFERETLEAIMDMMLDVICSKRKTIRIAGDDKCKFRSNGAANSHRRCACFGFIGAEHRPMGSFSWYYQARMLIPFISSLRLCRLSVSRDKTASA